MKLRKCSTCKQDKPLNQFRKDSSRSDGLHKTCNECNAEIQRAWYQRNKTKAAKKAKAKYAANKEVINAKRRDKYKKNAVKYKAARKKYYLNNKDKIRETAWRKAGIKDMTVEKYNQMYDQQNGCCAICGTHRKELKRNFSVDHNHDTGEVRGLLCGTCNRALGYFKDSLQMLTIATNYLKKYTTYGE